MKNGSIFSAFRKKNEQKGRKLMEIYENDQHQVYVVGNVINKPFDAVQILSCSLQYVLNYYKTVTEKNRQIHEQTISEAVEKSKIDKAMAEKKIDIQVVDK